MGTEEHAITRMQLTKSRLGILQKSGKKTTQFLQVINYEGEGTGVNRTERETYQLLETTDISMNNNTQIASRS